MEISLKKKYNFSQVVQLILLFLMSLNFANLYFYVIFLAFFICLFTNVRCFKIDVISIMLAIISICYILFYPSTRGSLTTILKQFAYPMCYLIGTNLFNANNLKKQIIHNTDDRIKLSILVVTVGTFLHYLLNASININSLLRNTVDFWTGEVVSATEQALLAVMALGIFSILLVGNYPVWKKIVSLFGLIAIFAYNFVLAGRTILVLEAITIFVAFFFMTKYMRANGRVKSYLFLSVIFIGVLILFLNNAWGIRDWILDSNLSYRFETQDALSDIRFERKIVYLFRMFEYPFGGGLLRLAVGGYAHELYLDIFSDVGLLGYGLIIAVVIACMVYVIKLFKSESLSVEARGLLLCIFLGMNIVFFLEPILQGSPWFFCIFCFLSGVVKNECYLLKHNKKFD